MISLTNYIEDIIKRNDWVVGGVNFDEDPHFSSFYIRASSMKYLGRRARTGYHTIIAIYQNFNETYYIPKQECELVAAYLLEKMKKQPDWMNHIVTNIYRRCIELRKVFDNYDILSDFSVLSHRQIMKLYKKHFIAHWRLYQLARIPEALDRGIGLLTGYLKTYLQNKSKLQDPIEINKLFCKLTTPTKPSIFQEEFFEFLEIVKAIEKIPAQKEVFKNPDRLLLLRADPTVLRRVEDHRKKWGFLEYHGYTYRKLPDLDYFVNRIKEYLRHDFLWKTKEQFANVINSIKEEQKALYSKYNIDTIHQKMFTVYGEIGLVKLFRRFIQLRNFFFLDKLMNEIAFRKGYEESIIRSLLPEEIERLLAGKLNVGEDIKSRTEFMVYLIHGNDEKVISGTKHLWIKEKLEAKVSSFSRSSELHGTPASLGHVRGICKILTRPEDAVIKGFQDGEIIISESIDPDLIPLVTKAGGVATEQGGVTCHATIICRELGKPALIGVRNLLHTIKDYDEIILDAYTGKISILKRRLW
ncbi:MAG: PEP-utilizing enzyme [Candidatus Bathyarchaeia archaeon]